MDSNENKQKDIKSFCKKYFSVFASIISDHETTNIDIDLLSLENVFIHSINSIGRILSSSYIIKHDIQLNASKQFGLKHFGFVQYISSILVNIIDLPILFPKEARLTAIRQTGKIISRVGWLKDQKYQRIVYSTARNFQARIPALSKLSSDFECSYLFALSHMAIDPQLQEILLKVIESYIPALTSNSNSGDSSRNLNNIKISLCKAIQKLDQTTDQIYKIMKNLAEDKNAHPEVSSEASLAFLCLSIKTNKRDTVKRITRGLSELIMTSQHPPNIKSAIKMLYNICSNDPSQKDELLPILMNFIKSDSQFHRDYALYVLSKLEIELNHNGYIKQIVSLIKNHFSVRMKNNQCSTLLKYVVKAAAVICSHYVEYAAMFNESIDTLLSSFTTLPFSTSSLFDVKIAFTEDEILKAAKKLKKKQKNADETGEDETELKTDNEIESKTEEENDDENDSKNESENEPKKVDGKESKIDDEDVSKTDGENSNSISNESESIEIDPFVGYALDTRPLSPDSIAVLTWRRELANLPQLLIFDLKVPEIGYAKSGDWFSAPKGFQIYEDVVSYFVMCCAYPERAGMSIPYFFQHLADQQRKSERIPVAWKQIASILDQFSVLNYIQLFFALCLMQQQKNEGENKAYLSVEGKVVKDLLCEMHAILDLLAKLKLKQEKKRVPTVEPPKTKRK